MLAFLSILVLLTGIFIRPALHLRAETEPVRRTEQLPVHPQNFYFRDSAMAMLRTGDLVLRTGNDMTSRMFCEFNRVNKTYSHGGLVIVEDGYPFVYHSIGGEDNPEERLRRDSAQFFLSPANNLGFGIVRYNLDDTILLRLKEVVSAYYRRKPLFDMDFSLETDDRLYCSEFVYKSLVAATGDSGFISPTRFFGYEFIGIDDLFICPEAIFVCEIRYK